MISQITPPIIYGLMVGSYYALLALGLSLIFGVMKVVNLSHGEIVVLSGYSAFWTYLIVGSLSLSFLVAPLVAFAVGAAMYWFIIRPIRGKPELFSLLVTFGVGLFIANSMILAWSAEYRSITHPLMVSPVDMGFASVSLGNLLSAVFSIALIFATYMFIERTMIGKAIKASAENREIAELLGINVNKVELISFGIGCTLAGLAGFWLTLNEYIAPTHTVAITVKAFILTAMAGAGSIIGILLSGIILGVGEALFVTFLSASYKELLGFLIFILILFLRPKGLFGR